MKTYLIQYRVDNGLLRRAFEVKAWSPAGAIGQVVRSLSDITGKLEIIATPIEKVKS